MPTVLFIAMHFPPYATGSGYLRTLKFCEHLPAFGWQPVVLTTTARAFGAVQPVQHFAPDYPVYRATALDAAKHLAIRGRYPGLIALPDRWVSWTPHAIWLARRAIKVHRPDVVVTTYPIATAHLIGLLVHRFSGIPWVADFRDPMVDETYPAERVTRAVRLWIERQTIDKCSLCIFTSPGTLQLYRDRYPRKPPESMTVIYNGYDEKDFGSVGTIQQDSVSDEGRPLVLVHSGSLYPDIRDPSAFFEAIEALKNSNQASADELQVVLRAPGSIDYYRAEIERRRIYDIVQLMPALDYASAVREIMTADVLLLFQGRAANRQIPTKLFEYMRSGRPVLALVDEQGDTAELIRSHDAGTVVQMTDPVAIANAIRTLIEKSPAANSTVFPTAATSFSRQAAAEVLASHLDSLL